MADPTPNDALAEGTWSRAWRDTKARCLSFPFFVVSAVVSIVAGGIGGVGIGLAVFVALILGVLIGSLWTAPKRQRDEARAALQELQTQREAPLEITMYTNPPLPIRVPENGKAVVVLTVAVQNHHPQDLP